MTDHPPGSLERWEARFAGPDYLFGTEPNAFLRREAARLRPGDRVLALADGEGRNGVFLAQQGLDVLSVDFSPTALAKAQSLARTRGVSLRTEQVDLEQWDWPVAAFDAVAAVFIQFAPPDLRARIFAGIRTVLKPGGLLLLEGYGPRQLEYKTGGPSTLDHLYTEALLREAFEGFEFLLLSENDRMIEEGAGHVGLSCLVDLVARKPL